MVAIDKNRGCVFIIYLLYIVVTALDRIYLRPWLLCVHNRD